MIIWCHSKYHFYSTRDAGNEDIVHDIINLLCLITSLYTFLEDREDLRITLVKTFKDPSKCWKSLLKNENSADPLTFNEMEKKMVLERFQREV